MAQTIDIYSAPDIEANRAGRLTDDQSRYLKAQARSFNRSMLTGAVLAAVIGVLLATATGPAPNASERPIAAAAFFAGAVVFLLLALRPNPESADARGGRVETVEGPIGKRHFSTSSGNSSSTTYYLEVGEKRYQVGGAEYNAAPDAGWIRLYLTPRTHKVVNFERLPDQVVPDVASITPRAILGELGKSIFSGDQQARNESRAEMAAMGNVMRAGMAIGDQPATRPAAGQLDPRPLATAILGTWQMGAVSVTFTPDGTMVATIMGSMKRQGRWSIGADGKLHADIADIAGPGRNGMADAWIAGDTLTISQEGGAAAFHRVS
jgi:hypothetical protein